MNFREFLIKEAYVKIVKNGKLTVKTVYHTSGANNIKSFRGPTWFSVKKEHADAWYENFIFDGVSEKDASIYSANIRGKVTDEADCEKQMEEAGISQFDYIMDLVSNPTGAEVLKMEGTKFLMKLGYIGFLHTDYDPRDSQEDLDSLLIFDKKAIYNIKKIK